jgi:hypothetical protein
MMMMIAGSIVNGRGSVGGGEIKERILRDEKDRSMLHI